MFNPPPSHILWVLCFLLVLLIFWKTLMALGDARKCFTSTEPWYPALPNRKRLIQTFSALASYRLLLCVHRVCLPFPWVWRSFDSHHLISKLARASRKKTSPEDERKGYHQVVVTPGLISWFQILKTGADLFVGNDTNLFYHEWGFLIHMVFFFFYFCFPTEEED